MDRRAYLAAATGVLVAGCSTAEDDTPTKEGDSQTEEETGPEEDGGPIVESTDRLVAALADADDGDVVTVRPDAELDLTGRWEITVPSGVTLVGTREDGRPGALLRSPEGDETPESNSSKRKLTLEQGARLTGCRLKGRYHEYVNPEEEHDGNYYAHNGGGGVTAMAGTEVDNNEISGWPYAAIFARGDPYIHDNYIHHNTWEGLGYGIAIPAGKHMPVIESNEFNYNRHSITGAGGSEVGFIARYNVVGEDWVGSQFDMHGTEGMEGIAGKRIVIQRNTFKATRSVEAKTRGPGQDHPAIDIRGTPTEGAYVQHNWFYHDTPESALRQPEGFENVYLESNHYGRREPTNRSIGAPDTRTEPGISERSEETIATRKQ